MKATPLTPAEEVCRDGVFTKDEAAEAMGISVRTLDRLLDDRKIPYTRAGKVRKIPRIAVMRYLAANLVEATS